MSSDDSSSQPGKHSWPQRLMTHLFGRLRSRQALMNVLSDAAKHQILDSEALSIIEGAIQVADIPVREIMIPRSQMVTVNISESPENFIPYMIKSTHSRFPAVGENPDDVIGILLAKDLLPIVYNNQLKKFDLKDILRPATFVPESKRVNVLLKEFRSTRNHMAIVIDEYGGVSGLVTIEDVLEQIVGEIEDEHDIDSDSNIKPFENNQFIVKAVTPLDEFNEFFDVNFKGSEVDTIGGLVTQQFGHIPQRDETIAIGELLFKIIHANNRNIRLLRVIKQTKVKSTI